MIAQADSEHTQAEGETFHKYIILMILLVHSMEAALIAFSIAFLVAILAYALRSFDHRLT